MCEWELGTPGGPRAARGSQTLRAKVATAQPLALPCAELEEGAETSAPGRRGSGQESGSGFDGRGGGRKPTRVGRTRLGAGFLFSPQAPLSSPLFPQGRNRPAGWAPTTRARQCGPAPGEPGPQVRGAPMWAGGGVGSPRRGPAPAPTDDLFARKLRQPARPPLTPHTFAESLGKLPPPPHISVRLTSIHPARPWQKIILSKSWAASLGA